MSTGRGAMLVPRLFVVALAVGALVAGGKLGLLHSVGLKFPTGSSSPGATADKAPAPAANLGAKLLAAAQRYDNEGYVWGAAHPPGSYYKGGGVDCSSLVNRAVLDATGVNEDRLAQNFRASRHWAAIGKDQIAPGDILYHLRQAGDSDSHVVMVVRNIGGGRADLFQAQGIMNDDGSSIPYDQQVGLTPNQSTGWYSGALRFHL